ncbi:MAG: ABC transporter ATP-binding protein [Candidatus Marinimicrobia bacterium]|nr:ABC transporter ATP-binding protein [Candidatus Neomarinimicrobiota bacterium]
MSLIQIEKVKKVFSETETPVTALDNISISIDKGSFISFIGPSGSGKTTLLNIIGALDKPSAGRIIFNNIELSTLNRVAAADFRAEHIGFIFQNFNLLPVLTVYENVEYPLLMTRNTSASERRHLVENVLDAVGMKTQMGKFPNQISGGQKQRVAIARALITNPELVLADEPTANLDHESAFKVIQLMHEMRSKFGTTFVFSTHDPKIVKEVDILHKLEDGKLIGTDNQGGVAA